MEKGGVFGGSEGSRPAQNVAFFVLGGANGGEPARGRQRTPEMRHKCRVSGVEVEGEPLNMKNTPMRACFGCST